MQLARTLSPDHLDFNRQLSRVRTLFALLNSPNAEIPASVVASLAAAVAATGDESLAEGASVDASEGPERLLAYIARVAAAADLSMLEDAQRPLVDLAVKLMIARAASGGAIEELRTSAGHQRGLFHGHGQASGTREPRAVGSGRSGPPGSSRSPESSLQPAHFQLVADIDQSHWWFLGRRAIMREVLEAVLPSDPAALVIDVGCGPGSNIASLADRYRCIGIDTASEAIALAEQRFPQVRFFCGLAPDDLDVESRKADAYLLMDVLEHVADDKALLASIIDVLEPGGLVFITVPADMRLWSEQDEQIGHHRRYDPPLLRALWTGLPVSEVMLSHYNSRLYVPVRAVRVLLRLTGRSWGDAGSDMKVSKGLGNRLLQRLFRGESRRLVALAKQDHVSSFHRGVSLMAVLRREPGPMPHHDHAH